MTPEPMGARKAFELLLGGEYAINGLPQDSYERAKAVMSAIVDQSEQLDDMLSAAWMRGREEAMEAAYAERDMWRLCGDPQRVDCAQWVASRIRSLPPPTPEQLKEIR